MSDIFKILKELPDQRPFYRYLNMRVDDIGEGWCRLFLPFDEKLTIGNNIIHGGVIASLMDVAGSMASSTLTKRRAPTMSIKIDFLRKAITDLTAFGEIVKRGLNVVFARIETHDADGNLIATGSGIYGVSDEAFSYGGSNYEI